MTVGQLKKLIADLPDETIVLEGASDHQYVESDASVEKMVLEGFRTSRGKDHGNWTEYWEGQEEIYALPFKVVKALVVGRR